MPIDLLKYITPKTVRFCREASTMTSVLEEISNLVSSTNKDLTQLKPVIYDALCAREMLGSTAITRGLALPHCRIPYISDFIIGILVSPEGIACKSLDRKASRVFVFIIAPQDSGNEYLKIMAELGSFLDTDGKIDTLAKAKNEEELYHTFLKLWEEYLHQDTQNL